MRGLAKSTAETSAAGDAHMAADAGAVVAAVDDEVVPLRLQADGVVDCSTEQLVVGGGPQRFAQIGGILVAEAGMQRPGTGDPDPVAGLAEIMGHRRDEAELAASLADTDVARRPSGIIVEVGQGVLLGEARAKQRQRHVLVDPPGADVAHRHDLDEGEVEALVAAGYLSSTEVGVVELTTLTGDLTGASIDSLLNEIRRRVLAANPDDAQAWPPGWSADDPGMGRRQNGEQSGDLSG